MGYKKKKWTLQINGKTTHLLRIDGGDKFTYVERFGGKKSYEFDDYLENCPSEFIEKNIKFKK